MPTKENELMKLIKSCLLVAAKEIYLDKQDWFKSVSPSTRTTERRIKGKINLNRKKKARNFKFPWFWMNQQI